MNSFEFVQTRNRLLGDRRFDEAHQIELSFLSENPSNITALRNASWTANALGRAADAKAFMDRAKKAYEAGQELSKQQHSERIRALIDLAAEHCRWIDGVAPSKFIQLIARHDIDDVPLWILENAARFSAGEIVDLAEFGRFAVGDANEVVHKRLCRGLPWEGPIAVLMMELASRLSPDRVILDVGANIGTIAIPMARASRGQVVAFEPFPKNHRDLLANIEINSVPNIDVRKVACGSAPGFVEMSKFDAANPGTARVETVGVGDIPISTIDMEVGKQSVGLIKMDVEGHEIHVIEGASRTIERDRPLILCELLAEHAQAIKSKLVGYGYSAEHVFRSDWLFIP